MGTINDGRETSKPSSSLSLPPPITTSTSRTETVKGWHEFKIRGYSLVKGMGIGEYITSDTFMVGGYTWVIYFYPDGMNVEDNATYMSLFIALSEGTDVRAFFELTFLDQSGKGMHKVHSHFDRRLETGPYALKYRGSMWGYKRFYKRTHLETSDYLKDDCLLFRCCVGVVQSQTVGTKTYTIPVPPSNIRQQFGKLLESGMGSDVSIEVDGDVFAAHKMVLAARSPVFRAQLVGPLKDKNTQWIKVEDIESPVFKALLHFIYSDSLPDMQELVGVHSKCASALMAQHLLAAADCYALERLRSLCETKLCEDITMNTVATTLALAEQHHCLQLKDVCLKFIALPENLKVMQFAHLLMLQYSSNVGHNAYVHAHEWFKQSIVKSLCCLSGFSLCFGMNKHLMTKRLVSFFSAVMETDGFEHLTESCPLVITELLQYVASIGAHAEVARGYGKRTLLDGSDVNLRRLKPRLY